MFVKGDPQVTYQDVIFAMDAALARLREAKTIGTMKAIADAEAMLDRVAKEPVATDLRQRLGELAEALFQSIRAH